MDTIQSVLAYRDGIVVLRDVDYSRSCVFWLVPMPDAEMEGWWLSQETFEDNPDGALDELYKVFGETPPPHSRIVLPGRMVDAEAQEEVDLWCRMADDGKHYICNICCDSDSYLRRPGGEFLYHRGFSGERYVNRATGN